MANVELSLDFVTSATKILELQGFTSIEAELSKDEIMYTCEISAEHPAKAGRITVRPMFPPEQAAQALLQSLLAMIESVNKTIGEALQSEPE